MQAHGHDLSRRSNACESFFKKFYTSCLQLDTICWLLRTARADFSGSFLVRCKLSMNGEPNCKRLFSLDDLGVIHSPQIVFEALSFVLMKGMVAALLPTRRSEVCSLCCGKQTPSWEIQAVKKHIASRFCKLPAW